MGAKPSKAAHHRDPSLETTSIPSSVQTTTSPTINIDGRIYHNIESSSYYLPRDEEEQDRLNSVCYFISNPCLSLSRFIHYLLFKPFLGTLCYQSPLFKVRCLISVIPMPHHQQQQRLNGFSSCSNILPYVEQRLPQNANILDIGCGSGSWVMVRKIGWYSSAHVSITETLWLCRKWPLNIPTPT